METTIKKAVLGAALVVAFLFAFAVPADDSPTWMLDLIESKLIFGCAALVFAVLNRKWKVYGLDE